MNCYADTSFLASLYLRDANSVRVKALLPTMGEALPLTAFHRVELRNAMSLAVFQQRLTLAEAAAAWSDFETDLSVGRLVAAAMNWSGVFAQAEDFARVHSPTSGNRSLDIVHVASAAALGVKVFYFFDRRQSDLARWAGLDVKT